MATQSKRSSSARPRAREDGESSGISRRALLGAGLGGAALIGAARSARAQAQHSVSLSGPHLRRNKMLDANLRFLVDRLTYGWTPQIWAEAKSLGFHGFLESQLDWTAIDDSAIEDWIALRYPTLAMTSMQLWNTYGVPGTYTQPMNELKIATLLRAVYSKAQLQQRMAEFWTDHFNIDHNDGECRLLKIADDRDVIRPHALGRFHDLVVASAHSGAMLVYLDNTTNKNTAPNENYARELMELHTLSPGNYTELDVKEAARCLTGWRRFSTTNPSYGNFEYYAPWHDNNAKTVLGVNFPAGGGQGDGDQLLSILRTHNACAQFVSRKMCKWLLTYDPPQALVNDVAAKYLATGGDVREMIRVILDPVWIEMVNPAQHPVKLRRPFHLMCSLLRTTDPQISGTSTSLLTELSSMSHLPMAWATPDGYPDSLDAWGTAVLPRWNFVSRYFDGSVSGVFVNSDKLFTDVAQADAARHIDELLAGGALAPEDVQAVQAFVNSQGTFTTTVKREALALAAQSPSFQYF